MSVVLIAKDGAPQFDTFWSLYPRKVARKAAQLAWAKLNDPQQRLAIYAIHAHAKQWRIEGRAMHIIPHASTWLNGERFLDELEGAQPISAWWQSEATIMAKGTEIGLPARPGESLSDYKGRIQVKLGA